MTHDDDRIAPVTPLFGSSHPAGRERAGARGGRRPSPAGQPAESAAGAWAPADEASPGADETPPALTDAALPTYAAFTARSEGAAGVEQGSDDDADPAPEETLEAARHRAENISLHALGRRGVSSREMEKTLRSRDLPDEVVTHEIERLERVGLLDDAELAENLVRQKQDRKGLGKSAVTAELRQRGIGQEAIDQAIAEIDDDDEQARADEWALKRAGQLRGLDHETAVRRLNGYLMRRGYRSEVARRAIEKALPRGGSSRGGSSRGGVRFE